MLVVAVLFAFACGVVGFQAGEQYAIGKGPHIVHHYMGPPEWWMAGIPENAPPFLIKDDVGTKSPSKNWTIHDVSIFGHDIGPRPGYCDPKIAKSIPFEKAVQEIR